MEFDALFTAIQGLMRSYQNTTIVPFMKIDKDNDRVSSKLIEAVEGLMKELDLKDDQKRRINLFFIVNTNFTCISYLEDDKNFWHLLGCLPKMSPYLYVKVVSHLKFHTFIGEVLYSCPEFISLEVFEEITDNLKLLNPDVSVPFLHSLYESTFHRIIQLSKDKKPPIIIKKFVNIFKSSVSFDFDDFLQSFEWGKTQKLIYFGYVTQMFLLTLKSCISKINNGNSIKPHDIYDFSAEFDYSKWGECKENINWTNHSLSIMVAKCADMLKSVTVDMYMSWCEEDVQGSVEKTLQTAVREAAYKCREEVRTILHLSDNINGLKPLESALSNIALQPTTEDDEIKNADAETIVMNLLNPKRTQVKWLKGLICIPGIFQSATYMQVIRDSAHLFDLDVSKALLENLLDFLSVSQCPKDFLENAKDLFFYCIRKQPLNLQINLLSYYFAQNYPISILRKENFEETLTTVLNKFSAANENKDEMVSDIVMLGFENSEVLVRTLLKECLSSSMKADILLELLSQVPPLASVPCSNSHLDVTALTTIHLMDSVITSLDKKKDNFIQLVKKLCAMGFLDGNIFFPSHILPRFEESIKENMIHQIIFFLDLLFVFAALPSTPSSPALLGFFAKLMDDMRPGISNFSLERMTATAKTVEIVQELLKKVVHAKETEDEEILWLRTVASELKGVSKLHLAVLWSRWNKEPPSLPSCTSVGLGLGNNLLTASSDQRRDIVTSTVKVLPTLTITEWYMLGSLDASNESLIIPTVEIIVDAILVSIQVPFLLKNMQIINNILINFPQFLWEKVIPKLKKINEKQAEKLLERISHLEEVLPSELKSSRVPQIHLIIQAIKRISG